MKVVVQKVNRSSVTVDNKIINEIQRGLCILVGFTEGDNESTIDFMVNKVTNLRVFEDENDIMNLSIKDIKGSILSISQFTLYGDATKGNRPSYIKALPGDKAKPLYELFNKKLNEIVPTYDGIFGADMKVLIENDGPTTIIIEK